MVFAYFFSSFPAGSSNGRESCFSITTIADDLKEVDEYFSLYFTNFMNGNPGQVVRSQVQISDEIKGYF